MPRKLGEKVLVFHNSKAFLESIWQMARGLTSRAKGRRHHTSPASTAV